MNEYDLRKKELKNLDNIRAYLFGEIKKDKDDNPPTFKELNKELYFAIQTSEEK